MATLLLSDRGRTSATVIYGSPSASAPGTVSPTPGTVQSDLNVIFNETALNGVAYSGYQTVSRWVGPVAPGTPINWSSTAGNYRQPTIDLVSEYSGPGTGGAQIVLGFTAGTTPTPGGTAVENFIWNTSPAQRVNNPGSTISNGIRIPNSPGTYINVGPGFQITAGSPGLQPIRAITNAPGGGVAIFGQSQVATSPTAGVFGAYLGSPSYSGGTQYFMSFQAGQNNTGVISTPGSTTSFTSLSDYRLKDEVTPIENGLSLIDALKPRTWKWKENEEPGIGFIAHEVQEVFPDASEFGLVTGEKDKTIPYGKLVDADGNAKRRLDPLTQEEEDEIIAQPNEQQSSDYANTGFTWVKTEDRPQYQGIDTSFLVGPLVASVKELKAIVEAHEARISALES